MPKLSTAELIELSMLPHSDKKQASHLTSNSVVARILELMPYIEDTKGLQLAVEKSKLLHSLLQEDLTKDLIEAFAEAYRRRPFYMTSIKIICLIDKLRNASAIELNQNHTIFHACVELLTREELVFFSEYKPTSDRVKKIIKLLYTVKDLFPWEDPIPEKDITILEYDFLIYFATGHRYFAESRNGYGEYPGRRQEGISSGAANVLRPAGRKVEFTRKLNLPLLELK